MDFQPNRLPEYTRGALLAEIKRVVAMHFAGRCPTHKEFNQFSRVHSATVAKEFGSWAGAMRAAGFEHLSSRVRGTQIGGDPREITRDVLLRELKSIAEKHTGGVFQYEDYKKLGGKRARGTFCKYLGGWRRAVARIGLKDGFSRPRPDLRTFVDEDYFAEMQSVWEKLGRQPKVREMRGYGNISPQSFQQRFGSWMRAVYAFCKDRRRPDKVDSVGARKQSELLDQLDEARQIGSKASTVSLQAEIDSLKKRTPRKPSIRLRFRVLQRDNFTCRACGRSPAREIGVTLEVDHIVAWTRGGETTVENLQTLCEQCNSGKSSA
jgi:hypothetical protein